MRWCELKSLRFWVVKRSRIEPDHIEKKTGKKASSTGMAEQDIDNIDTVASGGISDDEKGGVGAQSETITNLGSGKGGVGATPECITNSHANGGDSMKQLERIKIPEFGGNKMDFQRWYAAFTSCVDLTSLSSQFKMLRLEACLFGEAARQYEVWGIHSRRVKRQIGMEGW